MALTEWNATAPGFDPARDTARAALTRLPFLTRELARDYADARILAASPMAALALMLAGAAALWLTGAPLRPGFGWAVLMLVGITAMVRNHIRGAARSLRRVPLQEAAHDLRVLLLYTGAVWGGGAWLLMPVMPAPALVFTYAAGPALALVLILKDAKAVADFTLPATLGVCAAALMGAWPLSLWVASAILTAGLATILLAALQQGAKIRMPALTLR